MVAVMLLKRICKWYNRIKAEKNKSLYPFDSSIFILKWQMKIFNKRLKKIFINIRTLKMRPLFFYISKLYKPEQ
jgi:hypothetical protein